MLGWFRRYSRLKQENAELKQELEITEELVAALEENVASYKILAAEQRKNLDQHRLNLKLSEDTMDLVLTHLALAVYYKRDPLEAIGNIFKAMSPETCARVAKLIVTGRSNKC